MNNIPTGYLREGLQLAKGMRVFDTLVEELTKEELIACLAQYANSLRLRNEEERRRATAILASATPLPRTCAVP